MAALPEGEELSPQELVGLLDGVDAPVGQHLDHLGLGGEEKALNALSEISDKIRPLA